MPLAETPPETAEPQNRRTDKLSNVEVEWFVIPGYLVILR